MRRIYTFLLYLLIPTILVRLYWKGRRLPAYRQRIRERFSLNASQREPVDIWLHAVSLGEVVAATPLIDALLARHWTLMVTTMTPTGSQQVTKRFGNKVKHQYVPYDLPWVVRRFFKKYPARMGIIMETELWPNLINQTKRLNMPLLLANARLSDRAFKQYQKVGFVFKPVLSQFNAILAQSEADARRFITLGASKAQVSSIGNMKFDLQIPVSANDKCIQFKAQWGALRPVIIAASTHNDEERQIVTHLKTLKAAIPALVLLIAPRHPERFLEVYQLCVAQGFNVGLRSKHETVNASTEIVVIDSLGELLGFYQVSDYAFVGGSLVPVGGHNVLEPIAMKVPVFCGPFMQNSKAIAQELQSAGAMVMVEKIEELVEALVTMHKSETKRQEQVVNASAVLAANQGTITRYMEKIDILLTEH